MRFIWIWKSAIERELRLKKVWSMMNDAQSATT